METAVEIIERYFMKKNNILILKYYISENIGEYKLTSGRSSRKFYQNKLHNLKLLEKKSII
jgi:hypothetical protein